MGVVSPVGCSVADFWAALCAGRQGIGDITRFNTEGLSTNQAGEVDLSLLPGDVRDNEAVDIATRLAVAATREAVADANLEASGLDPNELGVVLATNFGGAVSAERLLTRCHDKGDARFTDLTEYSFQRAADHVAASCNAAGPRSVLSLSCSSGAAALGYGADLISAGHATAVVTGGYDSLSLLAWSGLSALRTMTKDAVRPFDKNRSGTLFSEGAGVIVVEDMEHARRRGAAIHAELTGWAYNNNAHHMTAPAKEGAGSAAVMADALARGNVSPDSIQHVNTHGTGTKYNDVTETQAIKTVFGRHAAGMTITSIKSMIGHMMGAAGSAEAIAAILSMNNGVVPPTINYREPDPECDLDCVVNTKRECVMDAVVSNSAGIGGCNAAVVFRRVPNE